MQIWTFSKHHTFKYDFWEKTQYSNMNFWCFLVTPVVLVNLVYLVNLVIKLNLVILGILVDLVS